MQKNKFVYRMKCFVPYSIPGDNLLDIRELLKNEAERRLKITIKNDGKNFGLFLKGYGDFIDPHYPSFRYSFNVILTPSDVNKSFKIKCEEKVLSIKGGEFVMIDEETIDKYAKEYFKGNKSRYQFWK